MGLDRREVVLRGRKFLLRTALLGLERRDPLLERRIRLLPLERLERVLDRLAFRRQLLAERLGARPQGGLLGR